MRLLLTILFVGIFCQAGSDLSANNIKPNYPLPKLDNNHNVESDTIKSILIIGDSQSTITTNSGKTLRHRINRNRNHRHSATGRRISGERDLGEGAERP